jgi:signal transduction histidine kinase/EAL domain-containing protein (putative c-di-GMP-specific phosphodiesterase class I)/GGDEF domain-containing protein
MGGVLVAGYAGSALVVLVWWLVTERSGLAELFLAMVAIAGLGATLQYLLVRENRRLVAQVDRGWEQARRSELRDAVTGLPNLAGFLGTLAGALAERPTEREGVRRPIAVVALRPNSPYLLDPSGSLELETVLSELARAVTTALTPADRLARTGVATLAILTYRDESQAVAFARELILGIEASATRPQPTLAVGIALAPSQGEHRRPTASDLTQRAAIALGTVASVPGGIALFSPAMLRDHAARFTLREGVVKALSSHPPTDIQVWYEPMVELATERVIGVAARAGWHDEKHGEVPAGRLTALAREAGLADRIDSVVLPEAIARFARWAARWPGQCGELWVTVCAETLSDPAFPDRLVHWLGQTALSPSALVLDPLDDLFRIPRGRAARRALRRVRELGIQVATSNVLTLADRTAPAGQDAQEEASEPGASGAADYFGISPVVVERCVDDLRARRLVQATVEYAATRHARTTARQVATVEQADQLYELGCTVARGPLFGGSVPATEFEMVLEKAAATWRAPATSEATRRRSSRAWQELRQIINALPIAAFAYDSRAGLVLAEGALLDRLGVTVGPGGVVKSDPPRQGAGLFGTALRQALSGEAVVVIVPVEDDHWLEIHLVPQADETGTTIGALGVAIDVTERYQAERALRDSEDQLRHAQKLEAVGVLAAGIAHEINTPIQFIGDNLHFLGESFEQLIELVTSMSGQAGTGPAAPEVERLAAQIDLPWLLEEVPNATRQSLEGVSRVATIVRAMRNFGHPDDRDPTPVDLNATIQDTAAVARNEYKYVADLELDLSEVPPVLGYPSEMHQVVLNLVVNAAHAIADRIDGTDHRGTITIRTWSDAENGANFSITDDGCGMTAETVDKIFNPFFTTKEVGRGTGQGLTTVYHVVVEKHGGTVDVTSAPGGGSVFTVRLPRSAPGSDRGQRPASS